MRTYLVLSDLSYRDQNFKRYHLAELPEEKEKSFVNKIMPVRFLPNESAIPEKSKIDPNRPLAIYLDIEKLKAGAAGGQYIDRELPASLKTLRSDETTIQHAIVTVADKLVDAIHSSEIARLNTERDQLEKQLLATKTAIKNVEGRLDAAINEWYGLQRAIAAREQSLEGWHETPVYERSQNTTPEEEIDGLILDYVALKKSVRNAHRSMRPHFELRMEVVRKQLNQALKAEAIVVE